MSKGSVDLGKGKISKLLFVLALPAITSQVVNALYNMVDRIFIGHIPNVGSIALTGVGVCFPIIMIISAFAGLVGMGGAPKAGIYMGKQENDKAEKILGNAFTASMVMGIVLTIIILVFKDSILYLFGASKNTIGYASDYISIYAIGTIFVLLTLSMNTYISTQGFAKTSMITVLLGAIINTILDPIFIYGLNMGVKGAAIATLISQIISCIWALSFLNGNRTKLKLKKENLKIEWSLFKECIALGIAPFIMQSTESLLILCFNSSLLKYGGDQAVGTMSILVSVLQFVILPLQGLTQGGQPIISYNYGAKNKSRVKKCVGLLIASSLVYTTIMWLICETQPQLLINIFTSDPSIVNMGKWAMPVYMFGLLLLGAQVACQQCFLAFGSASYSVFLAILRKILLLIPLIYIMPMVMENKVLAVFTAEPVADILAVLTTCSMFAYFFKNLLKNWDTNYR